MPSESAVAVAGPVQPRTVRSCDGCTLCCKVMEVKEIAKPGGKWCQHCTTGVGCGIYESRPLACSAYVCGYLTIPELTAEWKPAVSRLVLPSMVTDGSIIVQVDPARPDAWRRQPYYAELQKWSRRALGEQQRVIVYSAGHSIVILPDHAVDLGDVTPDELIIIMSGSTAATYEAYAVKREAWARVAPDIAQRKTVRPESTEGFRAGRRVG
jgi:hypothetical protein